MLTLVVARDINYGIGFNNDLPWGRIPSELKHFKDLTTGGTVVMGYNTFESIGKPLPKRINFVLSSSAEKIVALEEKYPGDVVRGFLSVESLLEYLHKHSDKHKRIYLIGGASLYNNEALLSHVTEIVETVILKAHDVDTYLNPISSKRFPLMDSKVMLDADRGMSYVIQYRTRFDSK